MLRYFEVKLFLYKCHQHLTYKLYRVCYWGLSDNIFISWRMSKNMKLKVAKCVFNLFVCYYIVSTLYISTEIECMLSYNYFKIAPRSFIAEHSYSILSLRMYLTHIPTRSMERRNLSYLLKNVPQKHTYEINGTIKTSVIRWEMYHLHPGTNI